MTLAFAWWQNCSPAGNKIQKSEVRRQKTGNWKLETGNWKLETGNWKLEINIYNNIFRSSTFFLFSLQQYLKSSIHIRKLF
jgi:hypothetical protein